MQSFPPTFVLRHRRENLKKCSLRGLEARKDFRFFKYPTAVLPDLSSYVLLTFDASPLCAAADTTKGLLILDATWRYAEKMRHYVESCVNLEYRSIPIEYQTSYPRCQRDCPYPERGLASIEAIYVAYRILGRDATGLLDGYYWKDSFLERNHNCLLICSQASCETSAPTT
jgi:pre-rRNA-processing protein TSR3